MNEKRNLVFDLEADGLKPSKIYCVSFYDVDRKESFTLTDLSEIKKVILNAKTLIGHNIICFDLVVLEKFLGIKDLSKISNRPKHLPEVIDTLGISRYLFFHTRNKHGLESWGETFGVPKPEVDDWENLSLETYIHRCEEDVKINVRLWSLIQTRFIELFGQTNKDQIKSCIRYLNFKMWCLKLQQDSGWKVDVKRVEQVLKEYEALKDKKSKIIEQAMPEVKVYKTKKRPKVMFKKDGSLSKNGEAWLTLTQSLGFDIDYDKDIEVFSHTEPPNSGSDKQIKDWLFSLGWKPDKFKESKSKTTGEVRQVPQINKEHGQGLTDSVLALIEENPAIEELDSLGVLNHRIPQLKGLLSYKDSDDLVFAGATAFTNTLRLRHSSPLVNLPKPEKKFGDIRSCLSSKMSSTYLIGADLSSLEDRIKQHFIWDFDPDYVRSMMRDDFDPHLELAKFAGTVSDEDISLYQQTEDKRVKKIRSIYKNGNYACQYGAGVPRLMVTVGCDKDTAQKVYDAYWGLNWSISEISKSQKIKTLKDKTLWLFNPINKMWYPLKKLKDVFSTLVQGSASFIFDVWLGFFLAKRPQLTAQFHDEFIAEVPVDRVKDAEDLIRAACDKLNSLLKLNRELDIDVKFGNNYAEIH